MKPHIRFGRLYLIEMVLNSGNNAFYGIFMPLHHSLGFPSMMLDGGLFDPMIPLDSPLSLLILGHTEGWFSVLRDL